MIRYGLFITATGTGVGKTFVARALARAWTRRGHSVAAIKPLETGCEPDPLDACALDAASHNSFAHAPGLYRAGPPLAPYAATLNGQPAPPPVSTLASRCHALAKHSDLLLVEGAGGLFVPVDPRADFADFALALRLPNLLVASDALGVLSHVLATHEAASSRGLRFQACVLTPVTADAHDVSPASNARILAERLPYPVLPVPQLPDDDDALADAAERTGLVETLSFS